MRRNLSGGAAPLIREDQPRIVNASGIAHCQATWLDRSKSTEKNLHMQLGSTLDTPGHNYGRTLMLPLTISCVVIDKLHITWLLFKPTVSLNVQLRQKRTKYARFSPLLSSSTS